MAHVKRSRVSPRMSRRDADLLHPEGASLNGQPVEQVGAAFNRQLLSDLLRKRYGFDGVVVTIGWSPTTALTCAE